LSADDALVTPGDDLASLPETRRSGDQRPREERLDVTWRNGRDRLMLERCHAYFR
jgi:hypothetical protein